MANKRSRPGVSEVRKSAAVGPDYPSAHYDNPWNMGIDETYGYDNSEKTLNSPTSTPIGMRAVELNGLSDYDSNWEHGVRGEVVGKPKGPREGSRWTPRGGKGK